MVAGIGGLALFVFLFFDWFSAGIEGFDGGGVDGWDGLGGDFTGFIVFLSAVAGVVLALLAMSGRKLNVPAPRGTGTAVLGLLSVAIIVWRIFANPGDLKVGLFLGLAAAIAIAAGALIALREDGIEALVSAAGGRTRASSASAPAATPAPPPAAAPAKSGGRGGGSAKPRTTARKAPARSSGSRSRASKSGSRSSSSRSRSSSAKGRSSSKSSSSRSRSSKSSSSRSSSSKSRSSRSSGSKSRSSRSSGGRSSRGGKK